MENTTKIVISLLGWIVPLIERDLSSISPEKQNTYLRNSTVGFGISYKMILDAANEIEVVRKQRNN